MDGKTYNAMNCLGSKFKEPVVPYSLSLTYTRLMTPRGVLNKTIRLRKPLAKSPNGLRVTSRGAKVISMPLFCEIRRTGWGEKEREEESMRK